MKKFSIPANSTLDQLRFTCGQTENLEFCKLTSLTTLEDATGKKNIASFEDVDISTILPDLFFIEITTSLNLPSVIASQLANNKHMLFTSEVFIQNNLTKIAVFR